MQHHPLSPDALARLVVLLPAQGLPPEADCWDRLHHAYSGWMVTTRTYTTSSVGVLAALSGRTWDAYSRAQGVAA